MKRIEDLEKMSFQDLEIAADDKSVKIPEDFSARLEAALISESLKDKGNKNRRLLNYGIGGVAAAAAAGIVLALNIPSEPKDTFNDPALAYAELEKTFSFISEKINIGLDIASEAAPAFDKASEIMDKINE